jgi:transcriptional regulator GlxA family with amidase domain
MKLREPEYELYDVLSEDGTAVRTSFGMDLTTQPLSRARFDTISVGAAVDVRPATPGMLAYLADATRTGRRIACISVGAFTLGEAGLLDRRGVTSHWAFVPQLQKRNDLSHNRLRDRQRDSEGWEKTDVARR